jgi:hypothetical protein
MAATIFPNWPKSLENIWSRHKQVFRKKELYARFGVPEYWIMNPVHYFIEQFMLTDEGYRLHATYGDEGLLTTERFPCMSIDLDQLFQAVKRFAMTNERASRSSIPNNVQRRLQNHCISGDGSVFLRMRIRPHPRAIVCPDQIR